MSYTSDLEHWRIEAKASHDHVEETHIISDPARGLRAQRTTRRWEVTKFLGRGGFGEVRLESHANKQRAVKRIRTAGMQLNNADYVRELKALLEFSKPKYKEAAVFVEFYGWFAHGPDVFLAMEYVPLGDLDKNLKSGKLGEAEAKDIGLQILLGLNIMHLESFAHRDLKPQNVLVVHGPPNWWVKLADFGLSKRMTTSTALDTRAGTVAYMAPEVQGYLPVNMASSGTEYSNVVDLWALGCIIYRLITGVVPFPTPRNLIDYCDDKLPFPEDALSDITLKGARFMRQLLQANPKTRLNTTEALKHPWVSDIGSTKRLSMTLQQPIATEAYPTVSDNSSQDYNTVSHAGLKSFEDSIQSASLMSSNSSLPREDSFTERKSFINVPTTSESNFVETSTRITEIDAATYKPSPPILKGKNVSRDARAYFVQSNPVKAPVPVAAPAKTRESTDDILELNPRFLNYKPLVPLRKPVELASPPSFTSENNDTVRFSPPVIQKPQTSNSQIDDSIQNPFLAKNDISADGNLTSTANIAEPGPHPPPHSKSLEKASAGQAPYDIGELVATAIYEHEGIAEDHELSFPKGATISGLVTVKPNWLFGSYANRYGIFPADHVRLDGSGYPVHLHGCLAMATYEHEGIVEDGELRFPKGAIISEIKNLNHKPAWLSGKYHGFSGIFPSNYVTILRDFARGDIPAAPKPFNNTKWQKPPPTNGNIPKVNPTYPIYTRPEPPKDVPPIWDLATASQIAEISRDQHWEKVLQENRMHVKKSRVSNIYPKHFELTLWDVATKEQRNQVLNPTERAMWRSVMANVEQVKTSKALSDKSKAYREGDAQRPTRGSGTPFVRTAPPLRQAALPGYQARELKAMRPNIIEISENQPKKSGFRAFLKRVVN